MDDLAYLMDELKPQNQELYKAKAALRKKFKKQGLTKQQIEIKMMQLDIDFLLHSYVNGILLQKSSTKKRLEFYIKTLKMYHDTE